MDTEREMTLDAAVKNLPQVMSFLKNFLKEIGCPFRTQMQIGMAAEEIFVNIASYAYPPLKTGRATVCVKKEDPAADTDRTAAVVTFIDQGIPYDPLAKEDPDITLPADKRRIGGLGIFMTKEVMDEIYYEYRDGSNILTMKKYF